MMVHTDIFKKYKLRCSMSNGSVNAWFPNGRNSIRVRLFDKKEVVFTYHGPKNWKIESMGSFLDSMCHTKLKIKREKSYEK